MRKILMLAAFIPAALAAQGKAEASPSTAPKAKPEIFFRFPNNGSTVGKTFPVVFGMRNYGVAPAGVKVNSTGHFHVLVDSDAPAAGAVIPNDSLHRHFGTGLIETTITLSPGTHTLRLVLGDFEHKVISDDLVSKPIQVTIKP